MGEIADWLMARGGLHLIGLSILILTAIGAVGISLPREKK